MSVKELWMIVTPDGISYTYDTMQDAVGDFADDDRVYYLTFDVGTCAPETFSEVTSDFLDMEGGELCV